MSITLSRRRRRRRRNALLFDPIFGIGKLDFFYEEKTREKSALINYFIERRTTTSLLGRAAVGASGVRQRRREKNKNNNKNKNGARKREEARAGEKREEAGREDDGEIKLGKTQSVLTDEVFGVHGADEKREADAGPLREQTPETTPAERVRRMRGRGKKENLWTFYKKERDESLRESKQHYPKLF